MKAITREEKIMSGEKLTPITRKEMFLSKIAGGGSGGGVSSWNDLTDRPFGEVEETYHALYWDGDTTDKVFVDPGYWGLRYYHVSDIVPTIEDLDAGCRLYTTYGEVGNLEWCDDGILVSFNHNDIIIVKRDNVLIEGIGSFPKRGIYFGRYEDGFGISCLEVKDFVEFDSHVRSVVVPLDEKYMPTAVPIVVTADWGGDGLKASHSYEQILEMISNKRSILLFDRYDGGWYALGVVTGEKIEFVGITHGHYPGSIVVISIWPDNSVASEQRYTNAIMMTSPGGLNFMIQIDDNGKLSATQM